VTLKSVFTGYLGQRSLSAFKFTDDLLLVSSIKIPVFFHLTSSFCKSFYDYEPVRSPPANREISPNKYVGQMLCEISGIKFDPYDF
jgi:hypothetical protein